MRNRKVLIIVAAVIAVPLLTYAVPAVILAGEAPSGTRVAGWRGSWSAPPTPPPTIAT
ncbi:hypothetical protein [Nonomuraea jabiensis]|uniref:hypothetical protein n=1 Tax=Nonomuraea jabiensis TaxID=882448 RepID=UPI003D762F18